MLPKPNKSGKIAALSALQLLGKVARLQEEANARQIIPPTRFGFEKSLPSELQVTRLVEHVTESFNQRHYKD